MDDAELLSRYIDTHSESAFSELVQRHFKVVFFAAMRQVGGDAHRAQDVSQMVFSDLARKAPKLVHRPTLAGWLYCSTRFAALHVMRAERRRERREQEVYAMQTLSPDSDAVLEWERLKPVVDDALLALKASDREAVLLRFFHGRPFADIGASLGITADAARFRIERALTRMRATLSRRGIASTSAALALALTSQVNAAPPAGLAATVAAAAFSEAATGVNLSTSVGLLKFMTTAKTTLSTLVVLLGAAVLGEAWLARSQAQEIERLQVARRNPGDENLSARLRTAQQQVAALEATQAVGAEIVAVKESDTPRPAAIGGQEPETARNSEPIAANFSQAFTMAMDDPAFRQLLAVAERARLNLFYDPLFKQLGLPPDQLERLKTLLVDKQQAVGDANRSALGLGMNQDAAYRAITGGQDAINSDIRSLLGDSGYAQYQSYEATRGQRIVVDQLRQSLAYTATPLSEDQATQVLQILFQNSRPGNPPSTNGLGAQVGAGLRERDLSAPIADQSLVAAQALLSPPQLDALRLLQQQQRERQRITQKLKQLSATSGGS